jgi:transcriptional regulator with XRE-family HTH domain
MALGYTQKQMAEFLGRSHRSVEAYEHGLRVMPADTWELLQIKVRVMLGGRL